MWLNQLFIEETIDFEKRCRMRMRVSAGMAILGLAAVFLGIAAERGMIPVLYLSADYYSFVPGFCTGIGCGLTAASIITWIRNKRYLSDPVIKKKKSIEENDERNRTMGLHCWAYAGYTMFLLLYVGMLISLFISTLVLKTLLVVMAAYGITLFVFRRILSKTM